MKRSEFIKINSCLALTLPIKFSMFNLLASNSTNMDYDKFNLKIGEYSGSIYKDLMFKYLGKDYFINASEEEVKRELHKYNHNADNIPSPFIAMLLEKDDEKILIDTGIGYSKEPLDFRGNSYHFQGKLMQILEQEKINKNQITQVILTHLHPDHIGGITNEDGELNFPNARYFIHEEEWNYWSSSSSDNQPPLFKYFIEKNVLHLKNNNLELIKGEQQEILPNVSAIKVPGHTPGQIALSIESGKDKLIYISDSFLHPLHIEHLDWKTNYDLDHELAKSSRKKLLEMAYRDNMQINAFHFDFPGLGTVDKMKDKWKWIYNE